MNCLKTMTELEALNYSIELWTFLAETGKEKIDWYAWKKFDRAPMNSCFLCEYANSKSGTYHPIEDMCINCSYGKIFGRCEKDNKAYHRWVHSKSTDIEGKKKIAMEFLDELKYIREVITSDKYNTELNAIHIIKEVLDKHKILYGEDKGILSLVLPKLPPVRAKDISKNRYARIKDGARVGIDMNVAEWKDDGEVFEVHNFNSDKKNLTREGYGVKENYGNGAIYVNVGDLIYTDIYGNEIVKKEKKIFCFYCGKETKKGETYFINGKDVCSECIEGWKVK